MTKTNPFRFSTKWWDDETGLGNCGRRYYDPDEGKWISRDPIEEYGGVNLSEYAGNNANNGYDQLGLLSADLKPLEQDVGLGGDSYAECHVDEFALGNIGYDDKGWYFTYIRTKGHCTIHVDKAKSKLAHEQEHVKDFETIGLDGLESLGRKYSNNRYLCWGIAKCVRETLQESASTVYQRLYAWRTIERVDLPGLAGGGATFGNKWKYKQQRDREYQEWKSALERMTKNLKWCEDECDK